MTERDLERYVADVAKAFGWKRYHTWLSKHSAAGFPDELLVRAPRLVVAELKSERGKLTAEQASWLAELAQVPGVEAYLWRPADMDAIERTLR
jgi:hypothetical protein